MPSSFETLFAGFPDKEFVQLVLEMLCEENIIVPSDEILFRLVDIRKKQDKNLESRINQLPAHILTTLDEMERVTPLLETALPEEKETKPNQGVSKSKAVSLLSEEILFVLIYRLQRKDVFVFTRMYESGENNLANAYKKWLARTSVAFRSSLV